MAGGKAPQYPRAPLAQHLSRRFRYRMKQTLYAVFVANRAERKREECFLQIAVPVEKHTLVFQITGLAVLGAFERLADGWPR